MFILQVTNTTASPAASTPVTRVLSASGTSPAIKWAPPHSGSTREPISWLRAETTIAITTETLTLTPGTRVTLQPTGRDVQTPWRRHRRPTTTMTMVWLVLRLVSSLWWRHCCSFSCLIISVFARYGNMSNISKINLLVSKTIVQFVVLSEAIRKHTHPYSSFKLGGNLTSSLIGSIWIV